MRRLLIATVSPFMAFLFLNTYINFSNTYLKKSHYKPVLKKTEIVSDSLIYADIDDNIAQLSVAGINSLMHKKYDK